MKKLLKILVVLLAAVFVAIQFFRPTFSDPPIVPGQPIEDSAHVPAEVQMVLSRSCNDCHSNKTVYPWYTQIVPVSWFMAGHIEDGRRELNFSEWNTYVVSKKVRKLEEVCEMVQSGAMPLASYTWMHRSAVLNAYEAKLLCDWANEEKAKFPAE